MIELGDPQLLVVVLGAVGGGGVAYGVTRNRVSKMEGAQEKLVLELAEHKTEDRTMHINMTDRLARIETKLDRLLNGSNRE